jgi:hypothetical protein
MLFSMHSDRLNKAKNDLKEVGRSSFKRVQFNRNSAQTTPTYHIRLKQF